MKKVLITGGSGMVGKALTALLLKHGYEVSWLTRRKNPDLEVEQYEWDWEKGKMDEQALQGIFALVHLAGTSLNERRWNSSFKDKIYNSRVHATAFLADALRKQQQKPEVFISSSAAGYYGLLTTDRILTEKDPPGDDFLAKTCADWEQAALSAESPAMRTVLLRTGVVLTRNGGALAEMLKIFRLGLGAALGSGKQYFSWIHLEDVCSSILFTLEHPEIRGPLNLTAPGYVTNEAFTHALASSIGKKIFLPPVPGRILKAVYGEVSGSLLGGSRIFPEKLLKAGFQFRYSELNGTLKDCV